MSCCTYFWNARISFSNLTGSGQAIFGKLAQCSIGQTLRHQSDVLRIIDLPDTLARSCHLDHLDRPSSVKEPQLLKAFRISFDLLHQPEEAIVGGVVL